MDFRSIPSTSTSDERYSDSSLDVPGLPVFSERRVVLASLLFGVIIFAVGAILDWTLLTVGQPMLHVVEISDALGGVVAGVLAYKLLRQERERRRRLRARVETISEMNHHVRNALQSFAIAEVGAAQHLNGTARERADEKGAQHRFVGDAAVPDHVKLVAGEGRSGLNLGENRVLLFRAAASQVGLDDRLDSEGVCALEAELGVGRGGQPAGAIVGGRVSRLTVVQQGSLAKGNSPADGGVVGVLGVHQRRSPHRFIVAVMRLKR